MKGNLRKMITRLNTTIEYSLPLSEQQVFMNDLLGKSFEIEYKNQINCVKCGRKTNKSFSQGFCFPCFQSAPETEECVLRPELCRAHEGIARDMEFSKNHCLIDHFVYLSLTSDIKVGVTRNTQVPTRWIDQGASKAIILAKTPNRYTAGLLEVALKQYLPDKTNWRNMLKGVIKGESDLVSVKNKIIDLIPRDLKEYISSDMTITELNYPLNEIPEKVSSLNFEKEPVVQGTLTGIKGQYLIFDNQFVLNIRKFGGYLVDLKV